MAIDSKLQAELDVLVAADRWARDIMRTDKVLDPGEQMLLDAVMVYQRLVRSSIDYSNFVTIPRPPIVPEDVKYMVAPPQPSLASLMDTVRYSKRPTMPSSPIGIRRKSERAADDIDYELDNFNEVFEVVNEEGDG